MNQEHLQEKYGALYPGTKLPPLVTADGVEVDGPHMTVYRVNSVDDVLITRMLPGDFVLVPHFHNLVWQDGDTVIKDWYSSAPAAYRAAASRLIAEMTAIHGPILKLIEKAGEPCE